MMAFFICERLRKVNLGKVWLINYIITCLIDTHIHTSQ